MVPKALVHELLTHMMPFGPISWVVLFYVIKSQLLLIIIIIMFHGMDCTPHSYVWTRPMTNGTIVS